MPLWILSAEYRYVLEDLCKLQKSWERKLPYFTQHGQGPCASSVLFAIEIARYRIAEDCTGRLIELNTLLDEWEQIVNREEVSTAVESIRGLDFGIRLVVRRVRRCLSRLARRKPPTSADSGKARSSDNSGKKGSLS